MNKIKEAHDDKAEVFSHAAVDSAPIMREYIGTKVIWATPEARNEQHGYSVRYADGYKSWSPRAAFEEAYRKLYYDTLSFGHALELLRAGHRVQRIGWNAAGQWIALQKPDENSKMGLPYLYISTVTGQLVPWLASQTDLLAEDWCVA